MRSLKRRIGTLEVMRARKLRDPREMSALELIEAFIDTLAPEYVGPEPSLDELQAVSRYVIAGAPIPPRMADVPFVRAFLARMAPDGEA